MPNDGSMSEWLGTGLQNRSHQFESGWNLKKREAELLVRLLSFLLLSFLVGSGLICVRRDKTTVCDDALYIHNVPE